MSRYDKERRFEKAGDASRIQVWESQMCSAIKTYGRYTMDTQFNAFEILQIAEEVESKAAQFYQQAAERFADEDRRRLCYGLADWRAEHRDAWRCLRRQYSERTGEFGCFDPNNYVLSNPQTMAGLTGFGTDRNGHSRTTGCETKEQILQDAIRRSQGIAIFYHGLKEFARGPDGRMMVDNILSEEDRHIRLLTNARGRLQAVCEDSDDPASMEMSVPSGV
jgi:rubrerythrin